MTTRKEVRVFLNKKWRTLKPTDVEYEEYTRVYNIKRAQILVFIMGMQDAMEEYFGRTPTSFKKVIKWDASSKLIEEYFRKARRVLWHLNVTRPEFSKLNTQLSNSQLNKLVNQQCIYDNDFELCDIVNAIKGSNGNMVKYAFESMKFWLACIERNGYRHAMISLGLMKQKEQITIDSQFEDYSSIPMVQRVVPKVKTAYEQAQEKIAMALPGLTKRLEEAKKEALLGPYHNLL